MDNGITIAVGAEGCTDIQNPDGTYPNWVREATDEEAIWWASSHKTPIRLIDDDNRPYFLLTVLENAPEEAKKRASGYHRVKYLLDN